MKGGELGRHIIKSRRKKMKLVRIVMMIIIMLNIGCGRNIPIEERVEILSEELMEKINKKWLNTWEISEKEKEEVKETISKINLLILKGDIKGFIDMLGERVEIINTLRDCKVVSKNEIQRSKKYIDWIKKWYFSSDKERRQSYRKYLIKLINGEDIEVEYKLTIWFKSDTIKTKKEYYLYDEDSEGVVYKYIWGFLKKYDDPEFYNKKDISIGINNFGDGWKIVALLIEP